MSCNCMARSMEVDAQSHSAGTFRGHSLWEAHRIPCFGAAQSLGYTDCISNDSASVGDLEWQLYAASV